MVTGRLRIMGQIDVVEEDQPGGKYSHKRAILIEFDSDEDIRQALDEMKCDFTFGDGDSDD